MTGRVLNGSGQPDKPDRTHRFGPGLGQKNTQGSGRTSGFLFYKTHFLQVVKYILFVVNHRCSCVVKTKSGCCFMGRRRRRRRPDAAEYNNTCMRKTMQAHGGSGSGRQLILVCRAASGSDLKTHGSGWVFRPVENSNDRL